MSIIIVGVGPAEFDGKSTRTCELVSNIYAEETSLSTPENLSNLSCSLSIMLFLIFAGFHWRSVGFVLEFNFSKK